MRLKLTDDNSHYVLEARSGTVTLSLQEMDHLAALIDQMRDQLRQSTSRAANALATTRISKATVSIDMHHTEVILRLQDRGFEHAYALPPDVARGVRDGISFQLEGIEESKTRTRQ